MAPTTAAPYRPLGRRSHIDWTGLVFRAIAYLLLLVLAVSTLFPFFWMVTTSFKQEQKIFLMPPQWIPKPFLLDAYIHIFKNMPFALYTYNSMKISTLSTVGVVLSSSLAAYAFARVRFPGRNSLFVVVLATMMIPFQVRMIPTYIIMDRLHWIDTHYPLWLPAFLGSAYGIFLVRQYMLTLPGELMDAARIDGCSHFGIYGRIVMPLSKPVLATLALITFMGGWNDLLGPLMYLNSDDKITLTLALTRFRGMNYTYWARTMAGATVSIVPVAILFVFTQQYFVQGVTLTGLKG